ncbi:MAG: Dicarboxylate transport [Syntrophus sp. PtaU1.Bin208]|nr:MAG: Dicarboxylate transport [Syntrophus sp. PtaU1.Bin208]
MTVDGKFDLKLSLSISPQRKMIEGLLTLRNGAARSASNRFSLTGLDIFLPYDLVLTGQSPPETARIARPGTVSFEGFEKGDLKIGRLETAIILSGNRLILPNAIAFPLFDGEIRLAAFRMDSLLFPQMRAETGLSIKHLNLEKLIGQAPPFHLAGRIDGNLSPVVFQEGKWSAGGKLVALIFGGQVLFENLSVGRPFSSSRSFGADVTFDDIDLEEVTANIKLGRMTGLIQGSLKNFVFEYGQPARFDLVITSDRSRKVPQSISVDAIKNLSIISTGSEAVSDILNSGLNRFFHEYPYSEIGIRCTLADDLFSLRGLIHEGSKEYLIRRALLRGIDIVNQNPDNSISFKDMAERMGRLFQPRQKSKEVPSG